MLTAELFVPKRIVSQRNQKNRLAAYLPLSSKHETYHSYNPLGSKHSWGPPFPETLLKMK